MTRDQYSVRSLLVAVSWVAIGLGCGRLAVANAGFGPGDLLACCAAGAAFGIACGLLTRRRYLAALVGFSAACLVTGTALPTVSIP
jgi:hypothetical protein